MITTAKIVGYDGDCLTLRPDGYIDNELLKKSVDKVEIRLVDGRTIVERTPSRGSQRIL